MHWHTSHTANEQLDVIKQAQSVRPLGVQLSESCKDIVDTEASFHSCVEGKLKGVQGRPVVEEVSRSCADLRKRRMFELPDEGSAGPGGSCGQDSYDFCSDSSISRGKRRVGLPHRVGIDKVGNEVKEVRATGYGRPVGKGGQVNALPGGLQMTRVEREKHDVWLKLQQARKEVEERKG